MSVDLAQLQRIHDLENEITTAELYVKAIRQQRTESVAGLPEYRTLKEAQSALHAAEVNLRLAVRDDRELNRLAVDRAEAMYHLRDLKEQLSHNLTAYMEDTGRDVIKDSQARNRHIDIYARLSRPSKRVLDQTKMSFSQHFGVRQAIAEVPAAKQLELVEEL
ncbi:UNVERIFIED_ORG: hypothetical protein ABID57_000674 [Arthrobacter sp. UYEF1]